jgi:nitrogen-specific signal transduction histidine kinase
VCAQPAEAAQVESVDCGAGGAGGHTVGEQIVEQHGGTLSVHSEPGQGTDFVIELPG